MDHSGKVDQDDVVRARSILLASAPPTPREEVDAYRVLARVSPAAYLPPLSRALLGLSYYTGTGRKHPDCLALREEALAAARTVDRSEPSRARVLYEALDACQRELYDLGRHGEGLAMHAEMLAIDRAQARAAGAPAVGGLHRWAAALSEAGRYREAADAMTELVTAVLPAGSDGGDLAWVLLDWIAALHDAGRPAEVLDAFEALVGTAAVPEDRHGPMACRLHAPIGHSLMLDAYGRGEQAALVRQEALALLTELAATDAWRTWTGYHSSFWAVLLSLSGAESDRPSPHGPRPPSGAAPTHWPPGAKRRCFGSRHTLREEVDALAARAAEDPDRQLGELVRLHRLLTVRSAVHWESHLVSGERVRSLFDEGVALARRLARHDPAAGAGALAGALIDRSGFHAAGCRFGPAVDDFRQALRCLGEAA
ncbi:hypothetical protein AB0N09_13795 [Streptomyces erythrochromogenes]|uniref:hypothetical protein n=1 Tax=Streptomyces erythrochromogenes TaxID=285574 RepID=UPI0034358E43